MSIPFGLNAPAARTTAVASGKPLARTQRTGTGRGGARHSDCAEPAHVGLQERPLMFGYWGRMGPVSKWMLDLSAVTQSEARDCATFCYSANNELATEWRSRGEAAFAVPTFSGNAEALYGLRSLIALRRALVRRLERDRTRVFVSLMPHVWSPLVAPAIRRSGAKHVVVVHDADPHPGDRSALATRWILREARMADHVITLSRFVADRLVDRRAFPQDRISALFHPDLDYRAPRIEPPDPRAPLRALFAGRILAYKGLDLLVEAMEFLRGQGIRVELGVYGSGEISASLRKRLSALGARVVNRWLSHAELSTALSNYDVVVAPHIEASQSGVVAAAFGAGLPVIVTPAGGLPEQVVAGKTGLICDALTPRALASSIGALAQDTGLRSRLKDGVFATRSQRSMTRFFDEICGIAFDGAEPMRIGRSTFAISRHVSE